MRSLAVLLVLMTGLASAAPDPDRKPPRGAKTAAWSGDARMRLKEARERLGDARKDHRARLEETREGSPRKQRESDAFRTDVRAGARAVTK